MKLSELIARLQSWKNGQGDLLVLMGAHDGLVFPRGPNIELTPCGSGDDILVLR